MTTILNVVPREKFPECPKCGFKMNWDDWGYSMVWNCLSGHYSRPATYEEILAEWGDVVVKL